MAEDPFAGVCKDDSKNELPKSPDYRSANDSTFSNSTGNEGTPPELLSFTCHVHSAKLHATSTTTEYDSYVKLVVLNYNRDTLTNRSSEVMQHTHQPHFDFSENFFRDIVSEQLNG